MITVQTRGCTLNQANRARMITQLRLHLGRFSEVISHVEATFSDENGPKGGIDKRCRLTINLSTGLPPVTVQHQSTSMNGALLNAVHKGKRSIARSIDRRRKLQRFA